MRKAEKDERERERERGTDGEEEREREREREKEKEKNREVRWKFYKKKIIIESIDATSIKKYIGETRTLSRINHCNKCC